MNSIQIKTNKLKYTPVNDMDMLLTLSNNAGGVYDDGTLIVLSKRGLSNEVRYLLCVSIGGKLYELFIGFDHYTSASITWEPSTETTDSFFKSEFINPYGPTPEPVLVPNVTQNYYNEEYSTLINDIISSSYNPNNVAATNFRSLRATNITVYKNRVKQTNLVFIPYFTTYYPGNSNSNFDEVSKLLFVLRYNTDYPYTLNFVCYNYVDVKGENNQSFKTFNLATHQNILRTNEVVYGWNAIGLTITPGRNTSGKNNTSILYNIIDQVITGSKNTTGSSELYGEGNIYDFNYTRGNWDNYGIHLSGINSGDAFGVCISGSRDHSVIAIGGNNDNYLLSTDNNIGYVKIFRKALPTSSSAPIVLEQIIYPAEEDELSCFGGSVCMSGDGTVLVIGTKLTNRIYYGPPTLFIGDFFFNNIKQFFNVYRYNPDAEEGSRWEFKTQYICPYTLQGPSPYALTNKGLNFPASISMNYDGTKIVASGYRVLDPNTELFRTKEDQFALVFHYDGNTSLQEVQKLTTPVQPDDDGPWPIYPPGGGYPDPIGASVRASFANYGFCCKLSEDEQFLLVSEITGNNTSTGQQGEFRLLPNVYIYRLNGTTYQLHSKIKAGYQVGSITPYADEFSVYNYYTYPDGSGYRYLHGYYFGYQLDISSDNQSIFIGDPSSSLIGELGSIDDVGGLMVYNFEIPPGYTSGVWTKSYDYLGDNGGDQFGLTMAKAYQQNYIAVASPGGNQGTGYFKVFKKFG